MEPQQSVPQVSPIQNPAQQPHVSHSHKRLTVLAIVLVLLFLVAMGSFAYQSYQMREAQQEAPLIPFPQVSPTPTPLPDLSNRVTDSQTKAGWKTFNGDYYAISFPAGWKFTSPVWGDTGFTQTMRLVSPSNTTALQIGLTYDFPHGFGPEASEHQRKKVQIKIGEKTYQGEEISYGNTISVYTMVETPDLEVSYKKRSTGQEDRLPMLFMFGNDYPLDDVSVSYSSNQQETQDNYLKDREEIIQILASFRFLEGEQAATKECNNSALKVSFSIPENWVCQNETSANIETWMKIESDEFTIDISSLGRGGPCPNGPERASCRYELFFQSDLIMLNNYFDSSVQGYEIFGELKNGSGTWISIRPKDVNMKSPSTVGESLLKEVFETLQITN